MGKKYKILIIEDDAALADGLCRALSSEEAGAESCGLLRLAEEKLAQGTYSLIILDVNLPDGSGFDYLTRLKQKYDIPVIMLTANDMEADIVAGLEAGADDYITKPFSLAVLRARVNAQLRKEERRAKADTAYRTDEFLFDFGKMEFFYKGNRVELGRTEQKLLYYLIANRGNTVTRSFLTDHIWTDGAEFVDENALSVSVKRLRDKLEGTDHIRTVYGVGYSWQ